MKKLLLITMLLFSTIAFSQTTYSITSITTGVMNTYTGVFKWSEYRDGDNMQVIMKKNIIFIDDRAGSVYTLLEKTLEKVYNDGTKQIGWESTDEQQKRCFVKFVKYPGGTVMLYVLYSNIAVGYTIE